ncbi:hypothetical protein NKY44_17020 [Sinorhizobium meliloti]|uniref:hypothetical protein n=1 Tax=Rhizobium meliloti TaxID=382 RepID=UPI00299DEA1A
MNIQLLSTPSILDLHTNIGRCLHEDDNAPAWREWEYGVRTYRDWAIQRDAFEAELARREIPFTPIVW